MALSAKRKAELASMDLPGDSEIRERARIFRQRSGLTMSEFSEAIGYGPTSLSVYLHNHYHGALNADHDGSRNTMNIRAALKQFMDVWENQQPGLHSHALHPTQDLRLITEACLSALEHGSACVIDGPPATQKTVSMRAVEKLVKERNDGSRAIYLYARINHTPLAFLRTVCNAAGVPNRGDIDQVILKLRYFLGKGRTLLMVDEANNLPNDTLDVLRQLLDLPPYFGVALGGSDDLTQRLSHWKMERWHSRVRKTLPVNGPSASECRAILRASLGALPDAACDGIIAKCQATATRADFVNGKPVARTFTYTSARKLFWAIERAVERAKEVVAFTPNPAVTQQKEGAA